MRQCLPAGSGIGAFHDYASMYKRLVADIHQQCLLFVVVPVTLQKYIIVSKLMCVQRMSVVPFTHT